MTKQEQMFCGELVAGSGQMEADKLRAYELYARLAGYFREAVEADVKVDVGVSFSELLKKAVMNAER